MSNDLKYPSNSNRSKAEEALKVEKRKEPVVKGKVKTKQNKTRSFLNQFISEDISNIKSYIFMDVLIPAAKKAISNAVSDGVDMLLYGEDGGSRRRRKSDRESYRSYYDDRDRERRRRRDDDDYERRSSRRFDCDELVFDTRSDAEAVRDAILDDMRDYGLITVAGLYDLADKTAPATANKYGWMGIRYVEIKRVRDGYILQLPKPMPID